MLDLLPTVSEGNNAQMPVDLSQYLLSASPPVSEFSLMGYSPHSHNHIGLQNLGSSSEATPSNNCPFHPSYSFFQSNSNDNFNLSNINNLNKAKNSPLKSIIMKSDCLSDSEVETSNQSSRPTSPGRPHKKVSFADHQGLELTQIRLVKESPDEPPQLSADLLASLTQGASADITCKPPIKLCFSQPASDYLAFRDKIQNNLVCLENVILNDYTAEGTIKVKNITFQKRVFVRLSTDEWATFEDHEAVFVPGPGLGSVDPFDTFSFKLEISPSFDVNKKVQFAVCFCENGNEHWDNNGGVNYCIVSEDCECSIKDLEPSFNERWLPIKRSDSWSEFSVWRDLDTGGPYY